MLEDHYGFNMFGALGSSRRSLLLGRDRELGELNAGLDELVSGHGGLFLLVGEPGIGKSRLADELGRLAASRGVAVHRGRCWEAGGAPSFWPFIQALRSVLRGRDALALGGLAGSHGAELIQLMPELAERLHGLGTPSESGTGSDRFRLFDAVSLVLHNAAEDRPLLLVLDDLHAADPSSLGLLAFLVRDLHSVPLLVLGTYREAEARLAPEISQALAHIAREGSVLPLRRLDRAEVAQIVAHATGTAPAAEVVDALHHRSEGNPLFLGELLRLSARTSSTATSLPLSEGIREIVRARLALLPRDLRAWLEAASVLGREFDLAVLTGVADGSARDVAACLAVAGAAGVVEPMEEPTRWRFTHVLLREGLYAELSVQKRAALHAAAAEVLLRRRSADSGAVLAEVAHHLLLAVPVVSVGHATDAALRAAERAMGVLAFEHAAALLAGTVERLEDCPGEERRLFEVQLGLGLAHIRAGNVTPGKDACSRAAALARRLGDGSCMARAALGYASEFAPNTIDATIPKLLEEALSVLPPGDGALRARCMARLASARNPSPDPQQPIALARRATAMARRLSDPDTLRFAVTHAGIALAVFAHPAERLAMDQEGLELALRADDEVFALQAYLHLFTDHLELGDVAAGGAQISAYETLARRYPVGHYQWQAPLMHASCALWEGRFEDAKAHFQAATTKAARGQGPGLALLAVPMAWARAVECYDELPAIEASVHAAYGALGAAHVSCVGQILLAQLHGRAGNREQARARLAAARSFPVFEALREPAYLALLAEPCHLLGDAALAARLRAALLPRALLFHNCSSGPTAMYFEPPVSRLLGLLAETMGRYDEAVDYLTDAEASTERAGMLSHLARLRYELAGALLLREGPDDIGRAHALLDSARTLAERLGQAGLLPRIAARAAHAPEASLLPSPSSLVPSAPLFTFTREGDYWSITCGGSALRLRDSRGARLLAQLLESPGQEFHVLQLISSGEHDRGDAGELLDARAVQAYRQRLLDLREALVDAEAIADHGGATRARDEMAFLTDELGRALGLGGRERRAGVAAERARTTVQKRLRDAVRRIAQGLPELGRHLDFAIRTGTFCGYLPQGRPSRRGAR